MATAARSTSKPTSRKRTEKAAQGTATPSELGHEEIAKRAYEKFLARGCMHGYDVQDWLDAEEEVSAEFREQQQ
jgi:hypothetical protein